MDGEETAAPAPRFAAHWVSPHGGVRVLLGTGATAAEARDLARRELVRSGFAGERDAEVEIAPVAWHRPRPRGSRRSRAA
jgi:hypothetical protein